MNEEKVKILVLDSETSGTDASKHGILDIGAVWLDGSGEFYSKIQLWHGAEWTQGAQEIHGVTETDARAITRPSERFVALQFLDWLGVNPVIIAGMNPAFDRAFLRAWFGRCGLGNDFARLFPHRLVDMHSLAMAAAMRVDYLIPLRGMYTDEIYYFLDMPPELKPHQAIIGARMEAEAINKLIYEQQR